MQVAQDKALDGVAVDPAPRLGQINFVNSLPVVLPLMRGYASVKGEITLESPAALNELYFVGRLDAGAMSSFFYLQHSDDLTLLPNVSISTSGAVGSVLFFFRSQPSGGKPYRLAVPSSSATSVALLQLYLLETFGVSPLIHSLSEPDAMDERFDGVLVIGDRALLEDDRWSSNFQRVDLGSWWSSTFSLPMVFGVWAARTHWAQQFAGSFMAVCDAICRARDIGLGCAFEEVVAEAERRTALSGSRLRRYYLDELDFRMDANHLQGLEMFGSLLRKHRLI